MCIHALFAILRLHRNMSNPGGSKPSKSAEWMRWGLALAALGGAAGMAVGGRYMRVAGQASKAASKAYASTVPRQAQAATRGSTQQAGRFVDTTSTSPVSSADMDFRGEVLRKVTKRQADTSSADSASQR